MHSESRDEEEWGEFMSRMIDGFDDLIKSRPSSVEDVIGALRTHDESITFLDPIRTSVPAVAELEVHRIATVMQECGYYASIQGPWLVCAKSRKRHDKMLFAAQATQVLAEANMRSFPFLRVDGCRIERTQHPEELSSCRVPSLASGC